MLRTIDIINPVYAFTGIFLCYSISGYIYNKDFYFEHVNTTFIIANILGLLTFLCIFLVTSNALSKNRKKTIPQPNLKSFRIILITFVLLYTLLDPEPLLDFIRFDPKPYTETAFRSERTAATGPLGFVKEVYIHCLIFLLLLPQLSIGRVSYLRLLIVALYVVFTIKGGSKGPLIYCFLILLINYNYNFKRVNGILVILLVIILIPLFSVFTHVRYVSSITGMFEIGAKLLVENPRLALPIAFGEFTGPTGILFKIIDYTGSSNAFNYGSRWLDELLVYIPIAILPDRPLPISEYYVQSFLSNAPKGYGAGWYILADGYWAFGHAGIVIMISFFAFLSALMHWFYLSNKNNPLFMLGYPYLYFLFFITSIRTGIFGTLKVAMMYTIVLVVIYFISHILTSVSRTNGCSNV